MLTAQLVDTRWQ